MSKPKLCSIEIAVDYLLSQDEMPVSTPAGDFLSSLPSCSHRKAMAGLLAQDVEWITPELRAVLASMLDEEAETPETLAVTMPWFTVIVMPRLGELAYSQIQAGDADAATDAALEQLIGLNQMTPDECESCCVIGVFEGRMPCLSWEG